MSRASFGILRELFFVLGHDVLEFLKGDEALGGCVDAGEYLVFVGVLFGVLGNTDDFED